MNPQIYNSSNNFNYNLKIDLKTILAKDKIKTQ